MKATIAMGTKIGFTGTREGMSDEQEEAFERLMPAATSFHHGSCKGCDVEAARAVYVKYGTYVHIVAHPGPDGDPCQEESGVDNERRQPKSHFARNRDIVNETDLLFACPVSMEELPKGGTWYTIRYARKQGKRIIILWPDGTTTEEKRT